MDQGGRKRTWSQDAKTPARRPATRKLSRWNTFCVVHPYSGHAQLDADLRGSCSGVSSSCPRLTQGFAVLRAC